MPAEDLKLKFILTGAVLGTGEWRQESPKRGEGGCGGHWENLLSHMLKHEVFDIKP